MAASASYLVKLSLKGFEAPSVQGQFKEIFGKPNE
jgi:hypothetical protein